MKEEIQLRKAMEALNGYDFTHPLHFYLRQFYYRNPNAGSQDRKTISGLLFNYFRAGNSLAWLPPAEQISAANFLIQQFPSPMLDYILKKYSKLSIEKIADQDKIAYLKSVYPEFEIKNIFPFNSQLSSEIDAEMFALSFLQQPAVWLRLMKGREQEVINNFHLSNLEFHIVEKNILSVKPGVPVDRTHSYSRGWFEIQDISSQKTADFFSAGENEYWWDCCAGSGGKTLLLKDKFPGVKMLVSDSRDRILKNGKERLEKAGVNNYELEMINLLDKGNAFSDSQQFDGIVADVPCSGSGTWSRSPEMLRSFDSGNIKEYVHRQKIILQNISPALKPGKPLIYITCSVFKSENEDVAEFAVNDLGFAVEKMQYLKGYERRADTLFVARLIKKAGA